MLFIVLLFFILVLIIYVYLYRDSKESYWKKRGVKFHPENKVFGVFWEFLTKEDAIFESLHKIYKQYPNEPAIGIGSLAAPSLFVIDLVNIQHIVATDFNAFNHRGFEVNKCDVLGNNLLFLTGKKWKLIRQSMTPLFTTTKLKSMYYILDKSARDFVTYLKDNPDLKNGDTFEVLSTFCSAAISAAVFGITTKSVFDSPFLKMAQESFRPSFKLNFRFSLGNICLPLFRILNIKLFAEQEPFFVGAIKQVLRHREEEKVKKHDFADLCVSLQSNGNLKDELGLEIKPTDELLAAQAFFFFLAGVDPTASAIYGVLLELGRNPDVLKRVHDEIDSVFQNDSDITYDSVSKMEYLDMVINEAMRLHPAVGYLGRECIQDTYLPVGNIKVDKGTKIFIPVFSIHHDERYYPDPERFNPERFSDKNITKDTFMSFGKGNRNCVGMRYAHYQVKAGLIHLLRHFTVETKIPDTGIKYKKDIIAVRIKNADIKLKDRDFKKVN